MTAQRVVGLLAREHGLSGLHALLASDRYALCALFTHRRRPRSEDEDRGERPEFSDYARAAREHGIPLFPVDTRAEARAMEERLAAEPFDLIAAISWRRMIPPQVLELPRVGGVNLHRGELPDFRGARPIAQALRAGRTEVVISAHVLVEELDAGEVLACSRHPARRDVHESLEQAEERLKAEITPLFGPLLLRGLDALLARRAD